MVQYSHTGTPPAPDGEPKMQTKQKNSATADVLGESDDNSKSLTADAPGESESRAGALDSVPDVPQTHSKGLQEFLKLHAAYSDLKALNAELLAALCDARDRMFGSGPSITALRDRSDALIAKASASGQCASQPPSVQPTTTEINPASSSVSVAVAKCGAAS